MRRALCLLLAAGAVALGQDREEDLVPYSSEEVENLIETFLHTYKDKDVPEGDALSVLANLKKAWRYLESRGEDKTKDEEKLQRKVISLISERGLFVRKRPSVSLECARILGELGAAAADEDLRKWLERVLDEKLPALRRVECGFQSLAWIGAQDGESLDLVLDYASKGKHRDSGVASLALRACYEWRHLEPRVREEFFGEIVDYLLGLWGGMGRGDFDERTKHEERYSAVRDEGLRCLEQLAGDGSKFANPLEADEWRKDHEKMKWQAYTGPRFRAKKAKKDENAL
jgi:hypothetical protein